MRNYLIKAGLIAGVKKADGSWDRVEILDKGSPSSQFNYEPTRLVSSLDTLKEYEVREGGLYPAQFVEFSYRDRSSRHIRIVSRTFYAKYELMLLEQIRRYLNGTGTRVKIISAEYQGTPR